MKCDIKDILDFPDTRKVIDEILNKYHKKEDIVQDVYLLAEQAAEIFARIEGYLFIVTSEGCIKSDKEIIDMFIPKYFDICMLYLKEHVIKKKDLYYQLEFNL